ncbi:MAG: hypothetical protein HOW73_29815 [Polyangiaceae bacterium]|nr:hypothetical protein [Polyangiaceae bacterium]
MAWSQWAKRLGGTSLLALVVATLGSSSCAEAEGRFYVKCRLPFGSDECNACDGDGVQQSEGSFNAAGCGIAEDGRPMGACGYAATLVIENQMLSSLEIEANHNQVETSNITIYAVDISFESNGGSFQSVEGATILANVPPGGVFCDNLLLFSGDGGVAPGDVVNVVAGIKYYGRTTGGIEVETPEQFISFTIFNNPGDCACEGDTGLGGIDGEPVLCETGCDSP